MARLRAWALCLGAAPLIAACATDEQKRSAINDVNAEFRVQYEQILTERGTRVYRANPDEAFAALRAALGRVGMRVADQSPRIGYLSVVGPAPSPLTEICGAVSMLFRLRNSFSSCEPHLF